jgi:hypothetical protein
MVYSENYDDQGGVTTTFSGLLSNMIGMFEEQVDKVIPEEVANFFGTNNEDESTRKSTDFHRQGKVFRQDKTHNHRGRRMSKSSVKRKVYNVPLNDEVYHSTSGVDTLEESYASPSRYSHSTDTNALTRASIQDLDHGWRAAYSEFRAEQSEGREDIQQKYASGDWETLDEGPEEADLRVPEEPHEVRSLALDEESPRMKALADEDLPQEESEEEVLQYSSPQEASKQGAPMEKQQSTMQSILTSWSSDCCLSRDMLDDEKEKYATARNKSSLMAELKTRIQNFTFERNLNIDQLLSKRKLDEDKDESTVHQGSLAPPPKYSVAHVKEATASPSSQDSFMKEVKKFHKKHILRKVSDEEKGPTKTLLTETTTLLFTPDEVSFTKEESQSNENTGEPGKRALVKKAPEKPKKAYSKQEKDKKRVEEDC